MILAMIVMVALVLIALAAAAPVVARDLRRDKEVESEHRAEQYVRAIRLYYRKNKVYPPSMDALEKSNNIRFLRHQYVDPLTGKPDWRIIHVGENQTTVKGFFGEPLGGLDTKGLGGGLGSAANLASPGTTGTSINTGCNAANSAFCNQAPTTSTSGGSGAAGASGATGSTGSSSSPSAFGSGGGVGQIMGVGSARSGSSILEPNEQTTYDTWEFLYDPRIELMYQKGALGGGIGSTSATGLGDATNNQSGGGNVFNTNGTGGGSGTGGAGSGGAGAGGGTTTPNSGTPPLR